MHRGVTSELGWNSLEIWPEILSILGTPTEGLPD